MINTSLRLIMCFLLPSFATANTPLTNKFIQSRYISSSTTVEKHKITDVIGSQRFSPEDQTEDYTPEKYIEYLISFSIGDVLDTRKIAPLYANIDKNLKFIYFKLMGSRVWIENKNGTIKEIDITTM